MHRGGRQRRWRTKDGGGKRGGGGQRRLLKSTLKFGGCAARTMGTVRRNGVIVSVCVKMKQCSRSVIASRRPPPAPPPPHPLTTHLVLADRRGSEQRGEQSLSSVCFKKPIRFATSAQSEVIGLLLINWNKVHFRFVIQKKKK